MRKFKVGDIARFIGQTDSRFTRGLMYTVKWHEEAETEYFAYDNDPTTGTKANPSDHPNPDWELVNPVENRVKRRYANWEYA